MRVLICGGRDYTKIKPAFKFIESFHCFSIDTGKGAITTVISGGAFGADRLGELWAELSGVEIDRYPADWDKYGKSAGFVRNSQMLKEGKPDMILALPGGKGTDMMCKIASKAGVPVHRL